MSPAFSPRRLALVGTLAAVLLAGGGALAFRPALVVDSIPAIAPVLEGVDPAVALLILTGLLVLVAPTLVASGRFRAPAPRPLVTDAERASARGGSGRPVVGEAFDRRARVATDYDGSSRRSREDARERVVEDLRPIAAEAYARATGVPTDEALAAVAAGEWTDDPRAAAFLADEDGPSTPVSLWLFDLVTAGDPFERSLERAIAEIEAIQSRSGVAA